MPILDLILHSAGEGIYGVDREGLTTFVNPAAARLLGYAAEELIGEPMHAVLHHKRPDGSPYPEKECPIYAAFRDGEVHRVDDEVFWRRDGTAFPVEYTSTPLRRDEELVGAVVVFWDVSARKRAEARLRAALDEVQRLKRRLEDENEYLQEEIRSGGSFGEILGESPAMRALRREIATVAPTDASVMVTGETGTGKELVARAVHEHSRRREHPLIKVNCAAVPRELFESEFFGHVRGAFTGAQRERSGRFGLADRGTLFLDEIGEVPLEMQGKLLRVLQEGTYERIGSERTRRVDVRIIAATNRDLEAEVEAGRFRRDLYYRLNVFPLAIPPLRERAGDVALLARRFLDTASRRMGRPRPPLTAGDVARLEAHDWPGNVRELQNMMERAAIYAGSGELQLPLDSPGSAAPPVTAPADDDVSSRPILTEGQVRDMEISNLRKALDRTGWRVYGAQGAAALLGMKPSTLASRIKKLRLQRPD